MNQEKWIYLSFITAGVIGYILKVYTEWKFSGGMITGAARHATAFCNDRKKARSAKI